MHVVHKLIIVLSAVSLAACDGALGGLFGAGKSTPMGDVSIYWSQPMARVNGTPLDLTEIQGYEIRYWLKGEKNYKAVRINGYSVDSYHFDNLPNPSEATFKIAVIDDSGIYSDFVTAK